MKIIQWLSIFCFLSCVSAQQAPWGRQDITISSHDRVYAADQTSNTVSVIFLIVTELKDPSQVVLRQARGASGPR